MSTERKYDIIDGVLLKRFLEKDDFDNLESVLSDKHEEIEINHEKRSKILDKLLNLYEKPTFGTLLGHLERQDVQRIADEVGISKDQLQRIYRDEILINRIPITRLKVFLETLNLTFEKVRDSIIRSSEVLSSQSKAMVLDKKIGIAFKRKISEGNSTVSWGNDFKSDLFDNDEALNKYLNKLNELMR